MKLSIITSILLLCMAASCSKSTQEISAVAIGYSPSAMIPVNTPTLSEEDSILIAESASKVAPEVKAEFDRKLAEWKDACNHSSIKYSSFMQDYTKPEQFTELVKMGEPIIPLVVEKMAQGDFFTKLIYEGIRPDEIFTDSHGSGQQRAVDYVKLRIDSVKRQAK